MGLMNWEAATGKKGPTFSIEDFTPDYNHWTAGFEDITLRTPTPMLVPKSTPKSTSVETLVPRYYNRFKS